MNAVVVAWLGLLFGLTGIGVVMSVVLGFIRSGLGGLR